MVPLTVGSCDSIKLRTDLSRSSRSSRRFVPACVVGFSAAVDAPNETLVGGAALRKMVASDGRVVLGRILGALGLMVAVVAFILGFYTLGGWG